MKDNAAMSESTLTLGDPQLAIQLFGPQDTHLRKVRNQLGVAITHRNGTVKVAGPSHSVDIATGILEKLKEKLIRGGGVLPEEIDALLHQAMVPATKNIAIDLRGESKEVAEILSIATSMRTPHTHVVSEFGYDGGIGGIT